MVICCYDDMKTWWYDEDDDDMLVCLFLSRHLSGGVSGALSVVTVRSTLHNLRLHYLHCIALYLYCKWHTVLWNFPITSDYTLAQLCQHCTPQHCIGFISFHWSTAPVALNWFMKLRCISVHYIELHCTNLRTTTLHNAIVNTAFLWI